MNNLILFLLKKYNRFGPTKNKWSRKKLISGNMLDYKAHFDMSLIYINLFCLLKNTMV